MPAVDVATETLPLRRSVWRRLMAVPRKIESLIGLFFCWGVGLMQIGLLLFLAAGPFVEPQSAPGRWAWLAVFTIPLSLVFLCVHVTGFTATWAALGSSRPLGIEAALRSRQWPAAVKPFAVLWWLLQFLLGFWMAIMFEAISYADPVHTQHAPVPPIDAPMPSPWFLLCVAFGLTFAGNTFLLQAVAVLTRDEAKLRRVWRMRLLIDAIVVLVPAALAYFGHHV